MVRLNYLNELNIHKNNHIRTYVLKEETINTIQNKFNNLHKTIELKVSKINILKTLWQHIIYLWGTVLFLWIVKNWRKFLLYTSLHCIEYCCAMVGCWTSLANYFYIIWINNCIFQFEDIHHTKRERAARELRKLKI